MMLMALQRNPHCCCSENWQPASVSVCTYEVLFQKGCLCSRFPDASGKAGDYPDRQSFFWGDWTHPCIFTQRRILIFGVPKFQYRIVSAIIGFNQCIRKTCSGLLCFMDHGRKELFHLRIPWQVRLIIDTVLKMAENMSQTFLMIGSIVIISLIMIMDECLLILLHRSTFETFMTFVLPEEI